MSIASTHLAAFGPASGLHPGDVAHRIGSGLREFPTDDVVHVWTDNGSVVAFGLLWPQWDAFDLGVHPNLPEADYQFVVDELASSAARDGRVETEVYSGDLRLTGLVSSIGFTKIGEPFVLTSHPVDGHRPVDLPGYTVRSATIADSDRICEAHVSAFSSSWTPEAYHRYMATPPYEPRFEVIAVEEDGTVAGFAVVWLDRMNSVGYFEPVGTHADHQRRGVGSAVLAAGMNLMLAEGMVRASVLHDTDSPGTAAFYASCGFARIGTISRWVRESGPEAA